MPGTLLIDLVEATLSNAQEKSAAGSYDEAIKQLTPFIDVIEKTDRKTRAAYGPHMVRMYSLRAKLLFESSDQGMVASKVKMAQRDVDKADGAFEEFYGGMDPAQKESIRASIHNMINPDERLRNDSFAVVSQIGTTIQPCPGLTSRRMVHSGSSPRRHAIITGKWRERILAFVIGAVLWSIAIALMFGAPGSLWRGIGIVLGLGLFILGLNGWDTFPIGGGGGTQLKIIATSLIAITGIGLIPIAYWTGKFILRLRDKMQGW